jgi:hypothetical protein
VWLDQPVPSGAIARATMRRTRWFVSSSIRCISAGSDESHTGMQSTIRVGTPSARRQPFQKIALDVQLPCTRCFHMPFANSSRSHCCSSVRPVFFMPRAAQSSSPGRTFALPFG